MANTTSTGAILVLFILLVIITTGYRKEAKAAPIYQEMYPVTVTGTEPAGMQAFTGCNLGGIQYSVGTKKCINNQCHICQYNGTWSPTGTSGCIACF